MNLSLAKDFFKIARWHNPLPIFFLALPCFWALALCEQSSGWDYLVFFLGAAFMRATGCIYNDYQDRFIDRHVQRTKERPLARESLRLSDAYVSFAIHLTPAFLIWIMYLNLISKMLCLFSLVLVGLYPFMKRWTFWPQLFLGFAFNWGVFVVQAQKGVSIMFPFLCLYVIGILWTLCYDTAYAYQDKTDDERIGVKSVAVLFGKSSNIFMLACVVLMTALCWTLGFFQLRSALYLIFVSVLCVGYGIMTYKFFEYKNYFFLSVFFGLGLWLCILFIQ